MKPAFMWCAYGLLLLPLVLARPAVAADGTVPVTIGRFVGLPADSADRGEFLLGFRAAMDADLPCEKHDGDGWTAAGPHRNPFRLVDVAAPDAAWVLDLDVGIPAPVRVARAKQKHDKHAPRARMSSLRASRGLVIAVSASPPAGAAPGVAPLAARFAVYFAAARRVIAPDARLAGGAYMFPWVDAGHATALAALEALHRASGALLVDERADLSPATRQQEEEAP